jgi:hypothetical protein
VSKGLRRFTLLNFRSAVANYNAEPTSDLDTVLDENGDTEELSDLLAQQISIGD